MESWGANDTYTASLVYQEFMDGIPAGSPPLSPADNLTMTKYISLMNSYAGNGVTQLPFIYIASQNCSSMILAVGKLKF